MESSDVHFYNVKSKYKLSDDKKLYGFGLEKDVFKVELPQDLEGDAYFVKERDTEINFNGTWKDSDNLINLKIFLIGLFLERII